MKKTKEFLKLTGCAASTACMTQAHDINWATIASSTPFVENNEAVFSQLDSHTLQLWYMKLNNIL